MDKRSSELQTKIDAKRRLGGRGGRRPALDAAQKWAVKRDYVGDPNATCRSLAERYHVSPATIWRALKAVAVVLLLSVNVACGWPPPPETVSIDVAFDDTERASILDGLEQWCEVVDWCARVVDHSAEGRIVASEEMDDGRTSVVNGKPVVKLNRVALAQFGAASFWRVAAHEIGHFGAEHTENGIMAGVASLPYDGAFCIDDAAVQLWCAAQGCTHTRGNCGP